ncbi:MAG: 23S rRNA (pseudouridine(1915)-N(3))-methyltransferase RlmH [Oscillospiraceae bacterium]|nr:23S rRNA (pseudouridine(1915)-N(3))-methyltransferase RlmH [Oscillospiraceae bacterium]MBR0451028.1 23S rRNA (pseudouridine(1915)-N(3))-methyltransferase RlmH [Oscillospiraceae bacterium]
MLTIQIICIGKMSQKWFQAGAEEYKKRLRAFDKVVIIEIPEYRITEDSEANRHEAVRREGEQILRLINENPNALKIALCVEGKEYSSEELAGLLQNTKNTTSKIVFVIGGSAGLSEEVKKACSVKLSMGRMTFPHQMARMILLEQLYRAETINMGIKYHK